MEVLDKLEKKARQCMKNDPSHDFGHVMRVYQNAQKICKSERANEKLVLSAVLLHDIVSYPKTTVKSKNSSVKSAQLAKTILKKLGYSTEEIKVISDAILDHSFSRGKIPKTIEGKILQDADRLDAIGAIGIARAFSVGGLGKRPLYHIEDPFCKNRKPNDKLCTLDHFFQKLLKLEDLMNTKSAKVEAKKRTKVLKDFLLEFKREL